VAMAEKENISDGADYRLTRDFGAFVALIVRSGRLPITRERLPASDYPRGEDFI
jgi:hypothetical protein